MHIDIMCWTSEQAGYSNVYTPIASYLGVQLGEYGEALERIEITMCIPTKARTLSKSEAKSFGSLPTICFRRKKRAMEIKCLSQTAVAADEVTRSLSVEKCNKAMPEVAAILAQMASKLKPHDDFDFASFIGDAKRLLSRPFASIEDCAFNAPGYSVSLAV